MHTHRFVFDLLVESWPHGPCTRAPTAIAISPTGRQRGGTPGARRPTATGSFTTPA